MSGDDPYRVAIKPSAWRASARIGRWVAREGGTREFFSKALAREWARECAGPRVTLWVQDAVPWDASDADGYLLGRTADAGEPPADTPSADRHQATLGAGSTPD